jgi:hypothetical protein
MPDHYEQEPEQEMKPEPKKKRVGKKLTDRQKEDLNKHMVKMKKDGMTASEMRSHRMSLMSRMRKDPKMTSSKAHKDLMKSQSSQ